MRKSNRIVIPVLNNHTAIPMLMYQLTLSSFFCLLTLCKNAANEYWGYSMLEITLTKNLAKMRLLAFEEKKNIKIDDLEEMRLLRNARKSVAEATTKTILKNQSEDSRENKISCHKEIV